MSRTSTHLICTMAALALIAFAGVPSAFAQEQPPQPKEEPAEAQKAPLKALFAKLEPRRPSPTTQPTLRPAEPQAEPGADHRPKQQVRNPLAPKTIYNVGL
ncbi:hypothetical protein [Roseateles sp.]|uniref:hypothetical protein n=1 Tax=Roseateles sp. TaxID=1971397 RepID=UPI0039E74144